MKKIFRTMFFVAVASLMSAGCAKDSVRNEENQVEVTINAGIPQTETKAACDYDGNGRHVTHWVMEVRESSGALFSREERKSVAPGTLSQTFKLTLYKGVTYDIQFWADSLGCFNTDDLTAVSLAGSKYITDSDIADAFSVNVNYTSAKNETITATLTRPFAQLNVQTTDLTDLWTVSFGSKDRTMYDSYAPGTFVVKASLPTTFNVKTQAAANLTSVELTAADCYKGYKEDGDDQQTTTYYRHVEPATMFMVYVFAGKDAQVADIDFSFKSKGNTIPYKFTSIPLQRNFRTNIKGRLMSNDTQWTVTIDPVWYGEYGIDI